MRDAGFWESELFATKGHIVHKRRPTLTVPLFVTFVIFRGKKSRLRGRRLNGLRLRDSPIQGLGKLLLGPFSWACASLQPRLKYFVPTALLSLPCASSSLLPSLPSCGISIRVNRRASAVKKSVSRCVSESGVGSDWGHTH